MSNILRGTVESGPVVPEIKAPGWELRQRTEWCVLDNAARCGIVAEHSRLQIDLRYYYFIDQHDMRITNRRREEAIRALWRYMLQEEAVRAGYV